MRGKKKFRSEKKSFQTFQSTLTVFPVLWENRSMRERCKSAMRVESATDPKRWWVEFRLLRAFLQNEAKRRIRIYLYMSLLGKSRLGLA